MEKNKSDFNNSSNLSNTLGNLNTPSKDIISINTPSNNRLDTTQGNIMHNTSYSVNTSEFKNKKTQKMTKNFKLDSSSSEQNLRKETSTNSILHNQSVYDPSTDAINALNMISDEPKSFYLACFDPLQKEIYFFDFMKEDLIWPPESGINLDENKTKIFKDLVFIFEKRWSMIKDLSELDDEEFLSEKSKKYLRRPMYSKFLHSERSELNNFNSCYPLPADFIRYQAVKIKVHFHSSVIKLDAEQDLKINRKIGFYYVVDTIIKDSLKQLLAHLKELEDIYPDKVEIFQEDIKNTSNKYVMKLKGLEEYMYGDYPISTYESVRKLVREHETVELFIMKFPLNGREVQPDVTHFPPIISLTEKKNWTYSSLINQYFELFVNQKSLEKTQIIFKIRPDPKFQEFYLKKKQSRREKLLKYCVSGESDFPFTINIKGIKNLFALKKHIDCHQYNKMEVFLPFFNQLKSFNDLGKKKNIFQKFWEKMISFCKTKEQKELEKHNGSDEEKNKKEQKKMIDKYYESRELQDELNYLTEEIKIEKINYEKPIGRISYYTNNSYSKVMFNELESLSSSKSDKKKKQVKIEKENFSLKNHKIPLIPCFIKIELVLMYGSFTIANHHTRFFLLRDDILLNEKMVFDKLLISHLPRETRLCINLIGYDKYQSNPFVLGSAQISLYDENGMMESGLIPLYIWPLFKTDSRIVFTLPYKGRVYLDRPDSGFNDEDYCKVYLEFPKFVSPSTFVLKNPQSYREFLKVKYDTQNINNEYEMVRLFANSMQHFEEIMHNLSNRDQYFLNLEKNRKEKREKELEMNEKKTAINENDKKKKNKSKQKDEEEEDFIDKSDPDIWRLLQNFLPDIRAKIQTDPLTPLSKADREEVIYCRDYICTIPSALEVFLRCINWLDPLQVYVAKNYLKKWEKLDPEDAICLLDAKFPDTSVREYAISIISEMTDDLVSMYILQLSQALIYEPYLMNPLSTFLIEKFLNNPKLIGTNLFWNAKVGQKNPLFRERLSVLLAQIFMVSGLDTLTYIDGLKEVNDVLKEAGSEVKKFKNLKKDEKTKYLVEKAPMIMDYLNKNYPPFFEEKITDPKDIDEKTILIYKLLQQEEKNNFGDFTFPIHPSFKSAKLDYKKFIVFDSKMVPSAIACTSIDGSSFRVIFKNGDDLRQDVLTLQILKVMDKMWLDNDLDLKITAYYAQPTALKEGYIEFVPSDSISKIQQKDGALDRELLIKHFNITREDDKKEVQENFILSLAGFCVATCVLAIADRHPSNVMVKTNGIFFHIDYGHFLGNWKYKFGFKRERAPFLLTPEMAHVYTKNSKEELFKSTCVKAFNILRKNANKLMNLFIMMSSAGLPELTGMKDVDSLKKMLKLDKQSDEDAGNHFIGLITESKNEKFRLLDNMIHNIKHG